MTDFERAIIRLWVNQPASFTKLIADFGDSKEREFFDKIDDLVNNELPDGRYCLNCISDQVSLRNRGNEEDSGYACDECGSMDIEG